MSLGGGGGGGLYFLKEREATKVILLCSKIFMYKERRKGEGEK